MLRELNMTFQFPDCHCSVDAVSPVASNILSVWLRLLAIWVSKSTDIVVIDMMGGASSLIDMK